jgi:pectate lyase
MLIGADPTHVGDRCIRVTIHHCFFDGTRQRHPRLRFGKVHLYNNYTRNWGIYAVCASVEAQVTHLHAVFICLQLAKHLEIHQFDGVMPPLHLQIVSQCNIYEGGDKKTVFKYMPEKVLQFSFLHIEHLQS